MVTTATSLRCLLLYAVVFSVTGAVVLHSGPQLWGCYAGVNSQVSSDIITIYVAGNFQGTNFSIIIYLFLTFRKLSFILNLNFIVYMFEYIIYVGQKLWKNMKFLSTEITSYTIMICRNECFKVYVLSLLLYFQFCGSKSS